MAACFRCGADAAFVLTLAVVFGPAFIRRIGIEIAGMSGALTAAFLARGVLWLVIYSWLGPPVVRALPLSVIAAGLIGLGVAGAQCRGVYCVWIHTIDGQWFRDRSEKIVAGVMGT